MAIELVNVGTTANDGTGDVNRTCWIKYNNSITDIDSRIGTASASSFNTGVATGGIGTINANNISVDITLGNGYVVDNYTNPEVPTSVAVSWIASNIAISSIASITKSWIYLTDAGVLSEQSSTPTAQDRRTKIFLCEVQIENSIIISIRQTANIINNLENNFLDFYEATGGAFITSGGAVTGNTSVLTLAFAQANLFCIGANASASNPNNLTIAAEDPLTFSVILRDQIIATGGRDVTAIIPNKYDNGGIETTVTSANATIQYLWFHGDDGFALQLGQQEYANITTAYDAIDTDFEAHVIPGDGWELICAMAVLDTATDASNTAHVQIRNGLNPLGHGSTSTGGGGGGGSTDHSVLTNRSLANAHPISAVTDLQSSLNYKADIGHIHSEGSIIGLDKYGTSYLDNAFADKLDITGGTPINPGITVYNLGSGSGIVLANGNWFKVAPTGNTTYTFTITKTSCEWTVKLTNGGAYTLTWPASVKWPAGVVPTFTASGTDIIKFETDDTGTTVYARAYLDMK